MDISQDVLTSRWYPLKPHPEQIRLVNSKARFRVVPAGRRSGKTERAKRFLVREAIRSSYYQWDDCRYFAAAPTRDQAKAIYWDDLKKLIPNWLFAKEPSESSLSIRLINGAEIWVLGMDKPQRIEGRPWNGGILDEYADMKSKTWFEHVRPALADRKGWCWFIGVPGGRNHYYKLYRRAKADDSGEWETFHWISADILPNDEIISAKRDLDELTYLQEYEASFLNFQGRVYYTFDERYHLAHLKKYYNPHEPLILMFDFNVEPGTAVVAQEMILPNGLPGTAIIGEVWIPRSSNTPAVCKKLIQDWGDHKGSVLIYGDATGGARGTAKVRGSDWDIVMDYMRAVFGYRASLKVDRVNPSERSRVNSVNTRLRSMSGEIRMMVDPKHAPHVVEDFEGVVFLEGGSGEIDKRSSPMLTHLTDAIGYYVHKVFGRKNDDLYEIKLMGL